MRWFSFIILAYLTLGVQLGLGGIDYVGRVDFVLIAVAFITINARRDAALPACFVLGLLYDLLGGITPIGAYALAYSMVALMVAGTERALAVEHPFTHFIVTFVGGIVAMIVLMTLGWWRATPLPFWGSVAGVFYTAIIALPVMWGLSKFRKGFKFKTSVG